MCGVPYGAVDVDRLLASLTLIEAAPGRFEVGVQEKGISALESLLFAKYQMYRNVYWHHAVRSATCMFKRAVRATVGRGSVDGRPSSPRPPMTASPSACSSRDSTGLAMAVAARRLYKRTLDLPASDVPAETPAMDRPDPDLLEQVEDRLAAECGLAPGELLLDFPAQSSMLAVDLPLRTRTGALERLTEAGAAGQFGLPRVADELYQSARRLRVFVASPPGRPLDGILDLLALPAPEVRRRLDEQTSLV